jgi:predicted aldo/keto reductase-like oxidoreductase
MQYKKLGNTEFEVGLIGLGTEYLEHEPREVVISVIREAVDNGVNFIDLFMASPGVRDNIGYALRDTRHNVLVAGHLGSVMEDGQYSRSRDVELSERYFMDLLCRLRTDYIDVLMLHCVDREEDYETTFGPKGLLGKAQELKKTGKVRVIGMSGHTVTTSLKAVNSGCIDVLMFPVNPATDTLPKDMLVETFLRADLYRNSPDEHAPRSKRRELLHACASHGVGVVAMKPYAAGILFRENPSSIVLTPVQCLSYALSQPAVCTTVPGCRSVDELKQALGYLQATDSEKDFSGIEANAMWKLSGNCMYCNHCLPCPVNADIGAITRLADTAEYGTDHRLVLEYEALSVKASACVECGECEERCPFGVAVIANMARASDRFEP